MELAGAAKMIFNALVVFQCVFFSLYLLGRENARRRVNLWLAGFLLSTMMGALEGFLGHFPELRGPLVASAPWLFYLFEPFVFLAAPFLYLYVLALTRDKVEIKPRLLLHAVPFLVVAAGTALRVASLPVSGIRSAVESGLFFPGWAENLLTAGVYVQFFLYMIAALFAIRGYRGRIKDLYSAIDRINLSWLNFLVFGFIGWRLLKLVELFVWRTGRTNVAIGLYILTAVLFLVFVSLIVLKGLRQPVIFLGADSPRARRRYERTLLPDDLALAYRRKLSSFMDTEKPFLNPLLSLPELASLVKIPAHHLSQVLNASFGQNFFDFVNGYRVRESQRLLASNPGGERTILDILYATGFNSKSVFNTAFKKHAGLTPSEFRRRLAEGSPAEAPGDGSTL